MTFEPNTARSVSPAAYSRFVAWVKIILPLIALGLLSTMFLFSRDVDPSRSIPYAKVDVESRARDPQLTAPYFAGVTDSGAEVSLTAKSARPGVQSEAPGAVIATIEKAIARVQTADGRTVTAVADRGEITRDDRAVLLGGVTIETSDGYLMQTDRMTAHFDSTLIEAPQRVTASGPLGRIESGSLRITAQPGGTAPLVVFNDGVRLIYHPGTDSR